MESVRFTGVWGHFFRTATVFQFKQILWHAGILATKADPGAGGGAANYGLEEDVWGLDERILRRKPTLAR